MDSLYDAPRQPPIPRISNEVNSTSPVVPEVSMIVQTSRKEQAINEWTRNNPGYIFNKENLKQGLTEQIYTQTSILKKQVRFESPLLLHEQVKNRICKPNIVNSTSPLHEMNINPPNLQGKTFEEIYLANIPNRHLDLSIVEPKIIKKTEKPVISQKSPPKMGPPTNYKEFCLKSKTEKDDMVTDILNYRCPKPKGLNFGRKSDMYESSKGELKNFKPSKFDNVTQTSHFEMEKSAKNDEPSLKDLLKIIQQQNEQIMQLQKQVLNLQNSNNLRIEPPPPLPPCCSTQHDNFQRPMCNNNNNSSPNKGPTFSFDLMRTSFEVSFRPQQNLFHRKPTSNKEYFNEAKIQEITEVDSVDERGDNLNLQESLHVTENCPSPEPSIKINMDDYHSSSEEDDDSSSEVGVTFYNNLMDQVNNMLKKAKIPTNTEYKENKKKTTINSKVADETLKKVKEATLRHLKSIGISLPANDDTDKIQSQIEQTESSKSDEISFAVKQLLMKYLPDEHLAKVFDKPTGKSENIENCNGIPARPEFSIATIEYMKKYNLLATDDRTKTSNF